MDHAFTGTEDDFDASLPGLPGEFAAVVETFVARGVDEQRREDCGTAPMVSPAVHTSFGRDEGFVTLLLRFFERMSTLAHRRHGLPGTGCETED